MFPGVNAFHLHASVMHDFIELLNYGRNRGKIEESCKKIPPPPGVKVCFDDLKGKALFADRDFETGEEIFRERCLVGLQVRVALGCRI